MTFKSLQNCTLWVNNTLIRIRRRNVVASLCDKGALGLLFLMKLQLQRCVHRRVICILLMYPSEPFSVSPFEKLLEKMQWGVLNWYPALLTINTERTKNLNGNYFLMALLWKALADRLLLWRCNRSEFFPSAVINGVHLVVDKFWLHTAISTQHSFIKAPHALLLLRFCGTEYCWFISQGVANWQHKLMISCCQISPTSS